MSDWLDLELAHRLRPVSAPEELWERIENVRAGGSRRRTTGVRPFLRRALPAAAMATAALVAMALWLADGREPVLDIRQLAAAPDGRLAAGAAPLDLHSGDPGEIRRWLQHTAGVDVPLRPVAGIKLEGARMVRGAGRKIAAVDYRVGPDSATLLVARADPACPLPQHGGRASAWQARDQVYAVACSNPERLEAACLLCHSAL